MNILIKGMEMPKHCFHCSTKVDPDNRRCNIDGHVFEETLGKLTYRRDDACPLVPIPPHGRLIDVNELHPYMLNEHYKYRLVYDADEVANAPTIIPAEEGET